MKVKILQENLSKGLSLAFRFTSSKAQLPTLGNILMEAKKNKLVLSATNLETSISISLGSQTEEEGEMSVPAKTICDIVQNLSKGQINLESDKEKLNIKAENFNSSISSISSSEFPVIPRSIDNKASVYNSKDFSLGLNNVLTSVSQDESRPVLTGVLFDFSESGLALVATDGFRLSLYVLALSDSPYSGTKIILPKNALLEIAKLCSESEEVSFSYIKESNQVICGFDKTILSTRVIGGNFPDYQKIIPKESKIEINCDREDFLRAVKLTSVFARDSANVAKLAIKKDQLVLSSESQQYGNENISVDAKIKGEIKDVESISFNYRFLEDFIGCVNGDSISIKINSVSSPGVFGDPMDPKYLHLIMPIKT